MNSLLEAIYSGNSAAVNRRLADEPSFLSQADAQGNTLLFYAVAQQDLALIKLLIKQGSDVKAKNHQGETVADWFQEYIASIYTAVKLVKLEEPLHQQIKEGNVPFISGGLQSGISRALRFSQGETMLHWAIKAQKLDIVKLILRGISQEDRDRLLNLKNSQGVTPLDLAAQQFHQHGTLVAQEIFHALREELPAMAPENTAPGVQPPSSEWPSPINKEFINKIHELSNGANHLITPDDFAQLNPLREVIVKLAYMTCRQALSRLTTVGTNGVFCSFVNQENSKQALFKNLFGS